MKPPWEPGQHAPSLPPWLARASRAGVVPGNATNNPSMKKSTLTTLALAGALACGGAASSRAQDSGALLDALVRKKVLTSQEAEEVRADLIEENAASNAGKLQLGSSVTSLKLYGDLRLRYQYDNKDAQVAHADGDTQRVRERLRARLNADFTLAGGFFGGAQLQTSQAADSGNQTLADSGNGAAGFGNYNIYLSRAFFGWGNDWLTLVGGKQPNPFYTTDLVWDGDINPTGFVEKIDLFKAFDALAGAADPSGLAPERPFGLSLVAGQFTFCDNNESLWDSDANTDVWLFTAQWIATARLTPGLRLTFAPGYMTYTAGNTADLNNETAFFNTKTSNGVTTTYLAASSQRDLSVIAAPGDFSFSVAGIKTKLLWDFAYNTRGKSRVENIYGLTGLGNVSGHSARDDIAWLAGVQFGENKKAGDWSLFANFRRTGLAAVDPNLNDSDFALGQLNMQGVKTGLGYNLTDFCVLAAAYYDAWNLRKDLTGGQTTGGLKIANMNAVQIFQLDLNLKF